MGTELSGLLGEIVDGRYRLGAPLGYSAAGAILETEFGPNDLPAAIKIREVQQESEDVARRWSNALEFQHPNVLRVYATGSSILNGVPVDYLVMERGDESLENVLAERALTVDETRRTLGPAVAALDYLHKNGYCHSRLSSSKVLAVGDQVKLSCNSAVPLREGNTAADDIRALGVLIVEALTQKVPERDGPLNLKEVPPPFKEIARHCLDPDPASRWTAEEVEANLNGPEIKVRTLAEPVARVTPMPLEDRGEEPPRRVIPKWIYAALAALVLIVVLVALIRKQNSAPVPTGSSHVIAQPAHPDTPVAPESAPKPSPLVPKSRRAARTAPTQSSSRVAAEKTGGWWVIVAAYNSSEAAEKRVRDLTKRWPGFHVTMSEPHSEKTRYLITLGQGLSEDQAQALRKRAVASGLPRDTYIKRVM